MPDPKSKKNVPKFVLARNEAAAPGATYIVHTQEPSFIGEIKKFDSLQERDAFIESNDDKEIVTVAPTTLFVVMKYLDSPDKSKNRDFLHKRIKHWIIANHIRFDAFGDS